MRASYHLNGSRHSSLRRNRETKDITPFKVKSWRGKPNPEGYLGERGSESASRSRSPIQRREVIGYKRKGGGYHRHAEIRKINASYTGGNVSQGITRGNTPHTTHRHKSIYIMCIYIIYLYLYSEQEIYGNAKRWVS